jgi:hypothetical protein
MKTKGSYDKLYSVRKYFVVNNGDGIELDPDLQPVVFSLPTPPKDWSKIKNYGLHPDDQIYRTDEVPKKLAQLEADVVEQFQEALASSRNNTITGYKLLMEFWDRVAKQYDVMEKEVAWMRHVIWKRYYGEWVFIDGKLTWFPPRYYMYVNFWYMSVKNGYERPEFRIRDWKSACVNHYLRHTHEGFSNLNKKGVAQKNEDGGYDVEDFGGRVFYGPIRPKNRRSGATHEALNEAHETVCTGVGKKATTLSKSVDDVEEFFDEMLYPSWVRMPMFLKPTWKGATATGQRLEYRPGANLYGALSMDSVVYYVKSTDEVVVDSKRLDFILLDEQGKKTGGGRVDVAERWSVSKQTLSTGDGASIHGFAMNPSTAEEMEDGAMQYKVMCDSSNFYVRSSSGQTSSGLMLVYFPAQYCLEGFVDCFGEAVVDTPTERQMTLTKKHYPHKEFPFIKRKVGAKEHLLSNRNLKLNSGRPEDLIAYRALMRKHPMRYAESWMGESGELGFPIIKIDKRLAEHESATMAWVDYGHFEWTHGFGSPVRWVPSDEGDKGRFELSMRVEKPFQNRTTKVKVYNGNNQQWEWQYGPSDPRIILGVDPFGFDNKSVAMQREDKSRKSDGGIGGYYPFDSRVDGEHDHDTWVSDRFILSYRYKPTSTDAFNEDVLMAAIYLGAWVYPEANITNTWEYFIRNGYGGYLKYDIDMQTGKPKAKPGYWMGEGTKGEMLSLMTGYLDRNAHRERHVPFLRECKEIRGPEELKNKDRLAAHGAALWGARDIDITVKAQESHNSVAEAYAALGIKM